MVSSEAEHVRTKPIMIAILSLLFIITLSILVTRIASKALAHTGLSSESARFQARSAFTGAGFTTNESEKVVNHPVRRRIIMILMLLGNAGIVSAASSLFLTMSNIGSGGYMWLRIAILLTGLILLWGLASNHIVDRYLSQIIDRALNRYTDLNVKDYASLMQLSGDYRIVEMLVEADDWLAAKTLARSRLREEGIIVLGVRRNDGTYIGVPNGDTMIVANDTLITYGRIDALQALDHRRKDIGGYLEHADAVAEQLTVEEKETVGDPIAQVRPPAQVEDC